ncbi:uncharacterized protein LOC122370775 [Amphibalanus amphitrite]|uniref:uncharacterized protein LOC122370775 n=1 Tax=Amphibalanus amphitrite TaxID=1232801 RepID=UPI001C8FA6E4|nr:uncharacterized protein LOC122370775 [Amphibalanus amphitrite]
MELLTHYVAENRRDWDLWLPVVASAYNSGCHSATGFSPGELVYGRPMRTVLEDEFDVENIKNQSHRQFLGELKKRLKHTHQKALELIRQKQSLRTDTRPATFQPGDAVWCRNFTAGKGVHGKLRPKFEGPYTVVEARPPDYVIRKGRKRRLIHGCHLKKGDSTAGEREMTVLEIEERHGTGRDDYAEANGPEVVSGETELAATTVTGGREEGVAEDVQLDGLNIDDQIPKSAVQPSRETDDAGLNPTELLEPVARAAQDTTVDGKTSAPDETPDEGAADNVKTVETSSTQDDSLEPDDLARTRDDLNETDISMMTSADETVPEAAGTTRTRYGREVRKPSRYL